MKVGLLNFFSLCGLVNVVIGPHPCGGAFAALAMYVCMGSILIGFTISMDPGLLKTVTAIIVTVDSLVYICLCLSNPGVPSVILKAARNKNRGLTVDRQNPNELVADHEQQ